MTNEEFIIASIVMLALLVAGMAHVRYHPRRHVFTLDDADFPATTFIPAIATELIRCHIVEGHILVLSGRIKTEVHYRAPGDLRLQEAPVLTGIIRQHLPSKRRWDYYELQFDIADLLAKLSARERLAIEHDLTR